MKLRTLKPQIKAMSTSTLQVIASTSWRSDKTSSSARGYTYKWQQARARHLSENPLCVYCAKTGRVYPASVVDHIEPHKGDMTLFWNPRNWQSLCGPCHSSTKQREEAKAQRY